MRLRRVSAYLWVAFFAVTLGWIVGPFGAASATTYECYVWVHPGGTTSGSYDGLNCGYHINCLTPSSGTALDWANAPDDAVYYRSYSSNNEGEETAGYAIVTESSQSVTGGTCYQTYVFQYRHSEVNDSAVKYTHTSTDDEWDEFNIASGYFPAWTSRVVGETVSEPSACETTGAHLHQQTYVGGNRWKNTTGYYPEMSTCSTACGDKDVFANYQLGYYWTE